MIEKDKSEKPSVQLVSSKELEDEYRALLLSNWVSDDFLRCLSLIEEQLRISHVIIMFPWDQPPPQRKQPRKSASRQISPNAAEYVREFVEHFDADLPEVPMEMPARQDEEKVELARRTEKASALLTLQIFLRPSGAVGLLMDCQSLLFTGCIHSLLPDLTAHRMVGERDLLLNSLWTHVKIVWDEDPAHKYFLQSQLFGMIDMPDRALGAMYQSFRLTKPSNHDWMTKAQSYWAGLIEAKQLDEARDFVLQTLRTAPLEHVAELTELVDETYHYIHRMRGRKGGSKTRST